MPRLTVTISDEHEEILQQRSDVGEAYRSKSEVIRECIESFERVEELSEQLACLEAEVEMLRDQRAQLKQKAARVDELEGKLRQLQAAYHQAIDEGRSPQELDPVETDIEAEPSASALIEEAESGTESPKSVESTTESPDGSAIEAAETVGSTVSEAAQTASAASEPSKTQQTATASRTQTQATASSTRDVSATSNSQKTPTASNTKQTASQPTESNTRGTQPNQPASARIESARPGEHTHTDQQPSNAESATDGGVEIDEELLYQSPSVGSRIKSALFGGPGGSR